MNEFALEFAKKFPELVDHFENGKPIFTEAGTVLFCFGVMEFCRKVFQLLGDKK